MLPIISLFADPIVAPINSKRKFLSLFFVFCRYLGFKTTIVLNKRLVVYLVDRYWNGTLSWNEFAEAVKTGHAGQFGTPAPRLEIRGKPKEEQHFYSNPYECLPPFTHNRS